jgi:hypothetical protein
MSQISIHRVLAAIILLAFAVVPAHAQAPTAPDSTLYTTYSLYSSDTTVSWVVCGSTTETEGCYASGSLGPFVAVGAMLEGNPAVSGNVVTRAIYVVDSGATDVKLYVYKKTDTVTAESDTVTVTLTHTITLPLTGGATVTTSMAANTGYLFIGTDLSPQGVEVKKSNLAVTTLGGFSPPMNVISITSDAYGYVTVTQANSSGESGFYLFGPNGGGEEDGGGSDFVLGTTQAVSLTSLASANAHPTRPIGYKPKASHQADEK